MPNLDDESVEEVLRCVGCSTTFDQYTEVGFVGTRGSVCTSCHQVCPSCNSDFNLNSGSTHAYDGSEHICYQCTRDEWRMCYRCDDWTHQDYTRSTSDGSRICDDCCDSYYSFCNSCEEYVEDTYFGDHASECHSGSGTINHYDYRPDPIFLHTDSDIENAPLRSNVDGNVVRKYRQIAYLGFELEMEYENGGMYTFGQGLDICDIPDVTYLKSDGSLNHGFEMVSHPMTLAWAMERFPWDAIEKLNDGSFQGWRSDTAGLHVHVSRDGFSGIAHQGRFINLITRNARMYQALAGRESHRWARFETDSLRNLSRKLRRVEHCERYLAVNVLNRATLEVRIFQSSLKAERLKMCLQLVDASVKYTENLTCKDVVSGVAFDSKSFIAWVATRPEYEILNSYLDTFSSTGQVGE